MSINTVTKLAFYPPQNAKLAAVAIILFEEDSKLKFFLTRRTSNVDHHKGQISLPGGAQDKGESFQETSLRESQEEIGIDIDLELIGQLTSLYAPVSGFLIFLSKSFGNNDFKLISLLFGVSLLLTSFSF